MARRCASAAILETLRDPRVVTLPAAAQTLWIRLVSAMQASNISVLRFGSDIMNQTGIALFIAIAETEIETQWDTLIERQLLSRDEDGAVMCPMLVAAINRSEVNRINGSRGGRPRKDGTPAGQRSMMLPLEGGKGKTEITKTETKMETKTAETPTYLLTESSIEVVSVSETEFAEIGMAVLEAMQIDPARSMMSYGHVRQWLADGADRALILDVVERRNKPGITTLKYFDGAIRDAIAMRPKKKPQWEKDYDLALSTWEMIGRGIEARPLLADFKPQVAA